MVYGVRASGDEGCGGGGVMCAKLIEPSIAFGDMLASTFTFTFIGARQYLLQIVRAVSIPITLIA